MPVATSHCPQCRSPLDESSGVRCPHCGTSLHHLPTRTLHNLNATTDFTVSLSSAEEDSLVGRQLDNYRIDQFLGQGGMARVYRAHHLTLERPCAIKVLKQSFVERAEDAAEAFLAEARAAAALVHPHVVTIHTIGFDDGHHFIEMEYIDGESLASLADTAAPFDPADATRFMVQICSALTLAHSHHMIHRDIKPANVLVTRDRTAKLADFGLAKRVKDLARHDGMILTGTPNYMAPELFAGHRADMRSDIYAMGVSYYLLLTGQLPFASTSITDLMQQHVSESPRDVCEVCPDIPDNAARVVRRCLSKDPQRRFADAAELLEELQAVYGSLRSLASLLQESLRGANVSVSGGRDRFEVVVMLPEGRRQKVLVEVRDSHAVAEQLIRISSICGPADEKHFLRALQLNPEFPYGALGVAEINGLPHFVMTNVYPRATCDAEEIRQAVLGIASHADEAERWLSEDDHH